MSVPEYFEFKDGQKMPRIGFGTWQAKDDVLESAVESALAAGYRHFDGARAYENEAALGRALKKWIGKDQAKRKELFVVTKLPPTGNRPESVEKFFNASLEDLGLDYIDLYLLHVPFAFVDVPNDLHPKNSDGTMQVDHSTDLVELWRTIVNLKKTGKVRHVGVSNMNEEQLIRLSQVEKPECLQIEVHASFQNVEMVDVAKRMGIPVVAYSPLGSKALADVLSANNGRHFPDLLNLPEVKRIASAHSKTSAQILLRQILQRGIAAIPKSTDPTRIKLNISVWDFELSEEEMKTLSSIDMGEKGRICDFSFFPGVEKHPEFPFKRV